MSEAALYAFPTALTVPVQQPRRRGRYPKGVISLTRIRRDRAEERRLEETSQAQATDKFRQQVRSALSHTLADDVRNNDIVGLVVCAIGADHQIRGWAVGLCCEDMGTARKLARKLRDWL